MIQFMKAWGFVLSRPVVFGLSGLMLICGAAESRAQDMSFDPVYGGLTALPRDNGANLAVIYAANGFSTERIIDQLGQTQVSYDYSAAGARTIRAEAMNGAETQTVDLSATRFLSSGAQQYFLPGRNYVYSAPGGDAAQTLTYITDRQGSVRSLIGRNGDIGQRIDYDLAGLPMDETSPGCAGDTDCASAVAMFDLRREQLQYRDALGLYDNHARFYDPIRQRFLHRDPARQSISPYSSRRGDPANFVDLNGAEPDFLFAAPVVSSLILKYATTDNITANILEFAGVFSGSVTPYDVAHINTRAYSVGPRPSSYERTQAFRKSFAYQLFMKSSKRFLLTKTASDRRKIFEETFFPFLERLSSFRPMPNHGAIETFTLGTPEGILTGRAGSDLFGISMNATPGIGHISFAIFAKDEHAGKVYGGALGLDRATGAHLFSMAAYAYHKKWGVGSIKELTGDWSENSTNLSVFRDHIEHGHAPIWAANHTPTGKYANRFLALSVQSEEDIRGCRGESMERITDAVQVSATFRPLSQSKKTLGRKRDLSQMSGNREDTRPVKGTFGPVFSE